MRKTITLACIALLAADAAYAARLQISPDAPAWAHLGAALLLILHIGGGAVGLVAGTVASATRKGAAVHRSAGKTFLLAMFITYLIGAGVAPFLLEGQRPNFVAGVLALYLLITGAMAARRREFTATAAEYVGFVIALTIVVLGAVFMHMGFNSESGTVDGSPPQAFILFIFAGTLAAIGELNVIIRRRLSNTARIARHLWRMCFAFFIAAASLFLGQPQVFPDAFNESIAPVLLSFAPLLAMIVFLIGIRLGPLAKRLRQPGDGFPN